MSVSFSKFAALTMILLLPPLVVGQSELLPLPGEGSTRQVTQLFEAPTGEPTPANSPNLQPTPGATPTPTPGFAGNILQLPGSDLITNGANSGRDSFQSVGDNVPFESPLNSSVAVGTGAPPLSNSRCGPGGCPNGRCNNGGGANVGPQVYTGLDPNSSLMQNQSNPSINAPLAGAASLYAGIIDGNSGMQPGQMLSLDGGNLGPPVATGSPLPCSSCNGGGAPILSAPSASIAGFGDGGFTGSGYGGGNLGGGGCASGACSAQSYVDAAPVQGGCADGSCSSGGSLGGVGSFASGLFGRMFSSSWLGGGGCGGGCGSGLLGGGCGGGCGRPRGACNGCPRFYGSAQYLYWWTRGQQTPTLATTSVPGTAIDRAGILGLPSTQTTLGGNRFGANGFSGGRFTFGYNLDCNGCNSIESSFFFLGSDSLLYDRSASGDEILARPFFNTLTGQPDAEFVGFPGLVEGRLRVTSNTDFRGYGVRLRHNLLACNPCFTRTGGPCGSCCGAGGGCGCGGGIGNLISNLCNGGGIRSFGIPRQGVQLRALDLLLGWRHYDLDETLRIEENLTSISTTNGIPPGTTLDIVDEFRTENRFDGVDVGLNWEWGAQRWGFNVLASLGIGNNRQRATIDGSTIVTVPNSDPVFNSGGLLALDSNIGVFEQQRFTVIPEVGANVYYCLFPGARLTFGYNLIYFDDALRPGSIIDSGVDPRLLPPKVDGYQNRPGFIAQSDNFWAQGVNLGLEFCF